MNTTKRTFLGVGAWVASELSAWSLDPFFRPNFGVRNVIGRWSLQLQSTKHVVTLVKDKSFSGTCLQEGKFVGSYSGTWTLDERDVLTWEYSPSSEISPGIIDKDRVMGATADTLTLRNASGVLRTWHREPEMEQQAKQPRH
jgi:hypothetical protein